MSVNNKIVLSITIYIFYTIGGILDIKLCLHIAQKLKLIYHVTLKYKLQASPQIEYKVILMSIQSKVKEHCYYSGAVPPQSAYIHTLSPWHCRLQQRHTRGRKDFI